MIGDLLTVEVVKGDITQETSDAITNMANARLNHGAGIAGAIVRVGGDEIQEQSTKYVQENGKIPIG